MIEIRTATTDADFAAVRRLTYALIALLQQLYPQAYELFAQDKQAMAAAAPAEILLVADHQGQIVGCVALYDRGQGICEMQQMFVDAPYRGQGIGRALATALIDEARRAGYGQMRLSTGAKQAAAQQLYRSLGFHEIAPYHAVPESLHSKLVFMALALGYAGEGALRCGRQQRYSGRH